MLKKVKKVEEEEKEVDLKAPQEAWADKMKAFFKDDEEVDVNWNDKTMTMLLTIDRNVVKRMALRELFPETITFGKIEVSIVIVDADRRGGKLFRPELLDAALKGNPNYVYMHVWDEPKMSNPMCWLEFAKGVVQYPADNLGSLYQEESYLPADLAKELFNGKTKHIYYDTVDPEKEPKPTDQKGEPLKMFVYNSEDFYLKNPEE